MDPDQARQNVGPDLDPNCLTLWWYSLNTFWKKSLKKNNNKKTDDIKACKITQHAKSLGAIVPLQTMVENPPSVYSHLNSLYAG